MEIIVDKYFILPKCSYPTFDKSNYISGNEMSIHNISHSTYLKWNDELLFTGCNFLFIHYINETNIKGYLLNRAHLIAIENMFDRDTYELTDIKKIFKIRYDDIEIISGSYLTPFLRKNKIEALINSI